jgi:Glycosyl transferase family 2
VLGGKPLNSKPFVSIVITNCNNGQFLAPAIASALGQTYSPIEVVVVDDGSTGHARAVIESFGDRLVAILQSELGQAAAINAGFAASHGDIVCLLNADEVFAPGKVAAVVQAFEQHADADWCFHPVPVFDRQGEVNNPVSRNEKIQFQDIRTWFYKGTLTDPLSAATLSGMCFRRRLWERMMPVPEAETTTLNSSYLKFVAIALAPGMTMAYPWARQRLHPHPSLSHQRNSPQLARIHVLVAFWMSIKFPSLIRFTNRLFATGVMLYWRSGGIKPFDRQLVRRYRTRLTVFQKVLLHLKSVYSYLKT